MSRTVVVAVDPSDHSKRAFDYYMNEIYRPDDNVVVVHIPEVPNLPTFSFKHGIAPPFDEWKNAIENQLEKVRRLEADYEAELISRKVKLKINFKFRGDSFKAPGEGIVAVAEAEGARMIIMGTRGLGAFRRSLLGSVSDFVVHHSHVPVLVCPNYKGSEDSAAGK